MRIQKILIVGAGIGGLCAATAARQRGIDVDVVEIQPRIDVYGVGIIQHGNVVREMAGLGLLQKYLARAFAFDDVVQYNADGELIRRIPGHHLAGEEYPAAVGISRRELHDVLISSAREAGADVRLGTTVDALDNRADRVDVTFSDGGHGAYDLVIGADGVHSRVRSLAFGTGLQPRFTGQSVWRQNFPRDPAIDHLASYAGPDCNAGLVPLGDNLMYMYLTSREPPDVRIPADKLPQNFRDRLAPFGGLIGQLREQIVDPEEIVYRPLAVIMVPPPWYRGRIVLIGDAAHATTPHLGQGAGMAVEDAVVLAELLSQDVPVELSLARFMERRYRRCKHILESSVTIGEWEMQRRSDVDRQNLVTRLHELTAEPI